MKMSIAMRLAVGFGALLLLSLGLSLFQLTTFRTSMGYLEAVTERDFRAYQLVVEIIHGRSTLRAMREAAVLQGVTGDLPTEGVTLAEYTRVTNELVAVMRELAGLAHRRATDPKTPVERHGSWEAMAASAEAMVALERQIQTKAENIFRLVSQGRPAEAIQMLSLTLADYRALDAHQGQIEELIKQVAEAAHQNVQNTFRQTVRTAFAAIVLMVLAAAAAAMLIGGSISRALRRFMDFVQMVGEGNLGAPLPVEGAGELARMSMQLDSMRQSLRGVATQTRSAAENMNAATAQIRASAQEQSAASAEQLSAIEETTATLTQITQSGAQITRRSQEVERNAQGAAALSEEGLRAVAATGQAMDAIREQVENVAATILRLSARTQAIGDIVLTVTNIAERAHLLALNASIEAAAAGEHGRTFSVVAGEIKRLADLCIEATERVRNNLGEVQQNITGAVMLADEAGKRVEAGRARTESTDRTIRNMAAAIQESVVAFQQIVAATNQHQIGLEQAMQALASVRQAASQTSLSTRELENAAANLNELSEALVDAVRNYRL